MQIAFVRHEIDCDMPSNTVRPSPSVSGQQTGAPAPQTKLVTIDAKPEPIPINPMNTAVIVVDMENDFAGKGGMFDRAGIDISGAQKAIQPTAQVLAAARAAGIKIVYLKMGYQP